MPTINQANVHNRMREKQQYTHEVYTQLCISLYTQLAVSNELHVAKCVKTFLQGTTGAANNISSPAPFMQLLQFCSLGEVRSDFCPLQITSTHTQC